MAQHTDTESVAQRVVSLLEERGLSGRRLARDLGFSAPYIARRLSGAVEFSESDIRAVAGRLDASFDSLLSPSTPTARPVDDPPVSAGRASSSVEGRS